MTFLSFIKKYAVFFFCREPPARVPYGKTVSPDCFSYPPALIKARGFRGLRSATGALPLDPASLYKGSTEIFIFFYEVKPRTAL